LGGWELDLRTQALYWTEETYRIADTSPEAFKPTIEGALGFYAPEYRDVLSEAVRGAIEDGRPYELELEMITTKGGRIWVHTNGRPVIENGRTIKVLGMLQDITERKQAEGALRYEKERLARIYQGSYDAIFVSDLVTGRYLDVNDAWERITGYPREEVLGRDSMNLDLWVNPDDRSAYYKELQADNHVRNRLIHIRHRLGHEVWAECNSSVMEQDGRRCMVSTARDVTERIQAERALHDSEEKFRRMLEAASIPIGIADIEGKIEYLNPRFIQDLAYNREDLPDMATWWLRAYPDPTYREEVLQIWHEAFARAQASGGDANMEQVFHLTCGDGQIRQVEIRAALAGSRAIVFIQDITARVRSEESLRDALELSDRLVSSQPMGIVSFHAESGACVRANEAMARMLGATVSQLMGHKFWDLPSWQESGLLAAANRALATESEQHVEGRILTIFGKPFWFSAILSTFHAGGDLHLLVVCEDITARKEAESALRKAYAAVEQSPAMILITDRQGAIEYVNEAFTRMSGYTFEEAMGRNPRILNSGLQDAALYKDLWNTVLDGQTWTGRLQNRRKDGQLFWSEAIISPLRNEAGEITHLVSSSMDITELLAAAESRQRLEEQVARTQKLESLGSLAGGVAHDMNNVLGAIMGLASVHQMIEPEGSALRKDMDTIVKACERGGTLVKGLLGFARKGLAEEQDVDLNNLVREEVALLSRTTLQRVQLKMDLTEDLLVVRGDASALSHLLMNLCVNAVDAMPDGGVLTLHTSPSGTGFVVLEVSDSGCGMSKDVLDKALDPFFTTKPQGKGTGLGLPIVYGTVKAHKGRMEIDSVPGQGTRVRVFLPAISREAESKAPPRMLHDEGRHLDVLVVDDDELVQDSLMQLLSALGHRSTVVNSGEQALLHLEANLPTDVVILDLNMPGQGGAATLPQIRKLLPHLPVLLATGRVDQDALDLLRKTPGVTLMPKPFNLADLRQHLEPFCGG
jgi:PAS domain S-box-containing protein